MLITVRIVKPKGMAYHFTGKLISNIIIEWKRINNMSNNHQKMKIRNVLFNFIYLFLINLFYLFIFLFYKCQVYNARNIFFYIHESLLSLLSPLGGLLFQLIYLWILYYGSIRVSPTLVFHYFSTFCFQVSIGFGHEENSALRASRII